MFRSGAFQTQSFVTESLANALLVRRDPQFARESLSVGNLPRSPCAPVGASWPALNARGCASLLPRVGSYIGGTLASPARYPDMTNSVTYPFHKSPSLHPQSIAKGTSGVPPMTALSVEFVAKPQEAHRVEAAIPSAIAGALKEVDGFAGCLVMISDHEARLVTVVTLWAGNDRAKCCSQNARWVHALLAPYLDRRLRVQTMVAHLPVLPMLHYVQTTRREANPSSECSVAHEFQSEDETVCVA